MDKSRDILKEFQQTLRKADALISQLLGEKNLTPEGTCVANTSNKSIEVIVTEYLHNLGIPAHIRGYQYLRTAIMIVIEDESIINSVVNRLYPTIAKKYETTPARVERACRHGIEVAFDSGNEENWKEVFAGITFSNGIKPTNSEFIATLADIIRLQTK